MSNLHILISNSGKLTVNNVIVRPKENNDYFTLYFFKMVGQISGSFENFHDFQKNFILTCFPIQMDEAKNTFTINNTEQEQIIHIEIAKKFIFHVQMPFTISWQSKTHTKGLIIKSYLANMPEEITNAVVKPIGKIKDKNNSRKDSFTCILQLKNIKPNGEFNWFIDYDFKPRNWLLSNQWGQKSDYDRKLIQKYTLEQKYLRFPKEFETLIQPFLKITDVYTIAKEIYTLAKQTIKVENLEYRKGVIKLLHDMRGDCDEFTDLMTVLLRKLSFPTRRVTGMVYDHVTNKITHHAWPEIYAPAYNIWVPIDAAMNFFGFRSLSVIPLKIEGTTVLPSTIELNLVDPSENVNTSLNMLDTVITVQFTE